MQRSTRKYRDNIDPGIKEHPGLNNEMLYRMGLFSLFTIGFALVVALATYMSIPSQPAAAPDMVSRDLNEKVNINENSNIIHKKEPSQTREPSVTETYTPPETDYSKFVKWLNEDKTNEREYLIDTSKKYADYYVCSHFTKDFLKNARKKGYDVFSVRLTGAPVGVFAWHIMAAAIIDSKLYFIEPQTDEIFEKEELYDEYGYQYAYFAKDVHINRNDANLEYPVRYNEIIGLNGENFIHIGK